VSFAAPLVIAAVLIFSAAAKAVDRRQVERAIHQLMGSAALASKIGAASVVIEWAMAICLLLWPASLAARSGVIVLFAAFAALGVFALVSGRAVDCGCFGSLYRARLGWTQIGQLIVVAAAAMLIFPRTDWPISSALSAMVAVNAAVGVGFMLAIGPKWRTVRQQRLSLAGPRSVEWGGIKAG
jgi:hypothetical protein